MILSTLLRTVPALALTATALGFLGPPHLLAQERAEPPADLRGLFAPGFLLADSNGDGFIDAIPARIRIAHTAGTAGVAAAANLSARLGFESYASHLELLESEPEAPVQAPILMVGTIDGLIRGAGLDPVEALRGLAPGEGVLHRLPPGDGIPQGGVWVDGGDATGLLAAATYLSARYPSIWDPDGPTLDEWADSLSVELASALSDDAKDPSDEAEELELEADPRPPEAGDAELIPVTLDRIVVGGGRDGILRLRVTARPATVEDSHRLNAHIRQEGEALLPGGIQRLELTVQAPDGSGTTHRLVPERDWSAADASAWQPRDVSDFTLSDLYTIRGIYRDTRQDLLPDRMEAVLSLAGTEGAEGAVALANRIGLEATGIRLPFARVGGEDDRPESHGFPILYGLDHSRTVRLIEEERLGLPTGAAGEGFVEFVVGALDGKHALVVGGTDADGLAAAASLTSGRLPYLNTYEKGQFGLAEMETGLRRFFQARDMAGTTALALVKLDQWMERIERGERPGILDSDSPWPPVLDDPDASPVERLELELALDSIPTGLEGYLTRRLEERLGASFPEAHFALALTATGFGAGEPVFDERVELEWEVDALRERLEADFYPRVAAVDAPPSIELEVRVSEPPEVREALAAEITQALTDRGADPAAVGVRVVNAYKQGFSWIEDHVLPRLVGSGVARIEIRYRHLQESDELPWQVVGSETRWLQELFPIDAVLARDLGIPDSDVVFLAVHDENEPIYHLRALDDAGGILLEEAFTPSYHVRPYFGIYDDYERVRVATGWVRGRIGDEVVLDERIVTDMERFWDHWQSEIQPRLRDYLMDIHDGAITSASAPFFDELRIEARLSEPNHRIGIDEEVISALESLHNDLYFTSIAFFSHLGNHYGVGGLNFPGRILPHIDPTGDGEPGVARFTLIGRSKAQPELVLRTRTGDGETGRWRYSLASPLPVEAPRLRGLSVIAGDVPIRRALVDIVARDSIDRWSEHRTRASEAAVDRAFLSVELLEGMVETVRGLHGAGVLEEALAFEGVGELSFRFRVEDDEGEDDAPGDDPDPDTGDADAGRDDEGDEESDDRRARTDPAGLDRRGGFERIVHLPTSARPTPTRRPVLRAEGFELPDHVDTGRELDFPESMVQWEAPIAPAESDSILARLAAFPEVTAYHVGKSYLGRDMFAADFLPPIAGPYRSELKLTALKPTLMLSARQHANEVSSTSHLLRLGEILVRDTEYREMLRRVNVILHPITNADGAQLAWEMQQINPDFTLHAGYLGALGVDVTAGAGSPDPIYPEANVRPDLMATWLPDIFMNLHGYPSHEWVQHFSGYAAWVRGRTVTQRTWWAPRGWFIPGYSYVDDPEHPEIREAQFAILDSLAAAITGEPRVQAMSERQYDRYRKYGRQDVDGFAEHFHEGMLVYLSLRGRPAQGSGPTDPRILTFSATTEAPDETARGDWLRLVNTAGLAHTSALLRYLNTGVPRVEREAEAFEGGVARTLHRVRPVLPEEPDGDPESE